MKFTASCVKANRDVVCHRNSVLDVRVCLPLGLIVSLTVPPPVDKVDGEAGVGRIRCKVVEKNAELIKLSGLLASIR